MQRSPYQGDFCITNPKRPPLSLKKRRLRRELKDLDFSSASMERKERQGPSPAAQDDNIAKPMGYAKLSLARREGAALPLFLTGEVLL
jgi:hypothetical protein